MTVICPWCFRTYQSMAAWAQDFDENHPVVARIDKVMPILNTPPAQGA